MKKLIISSALMFATFLAAPLHAQESVNVVINENGTQREETIDLPRSMTYPLDSLLNDWKAKTYIDLGKDCSTSHENPLFSDSIYIDRLSRMPVIMEMPYNEIVRKFIDMYATRLRNQVAFMLSACNFYMPIFEKALDAYDLPLELKYLPIIESALNPSAVSRAGAAGLWQFMLQTGKLYGLESNSLVDRAGGKTDYWAIYNYLPRETRGYVPAFIAANYIMSYYCKHNICPMETNIPEATDTIQVSRNLHFEQIVDICHVPMDELKSLNPQYKRSIIPGDSKPQTLRLPMNAISTFIDNQDTIYNHRQAELFKNRRTVSVASSNTSKAVAGNGKPIYYKIKNGDTLGGIAQRYGVSVSKLRSWNGLRGNNIRAGKTLKIYK